jgi:glycosyltransferase involved in cell wall biosynthesis
MHVAFITSHFPFRDASSVGGIGTSIKNLGDELVKAGHRVSVFVYGQSGDSQTNESGLDIYKIKNVRLKGFSWLLTRKKIQRTIREVSRINRIDIVEAPDWEGISSFINVDCPLVVRLNGSDTYFCDLDGRKVKSRNRFQEKRAFEKADAIISVSKFTGERTNAIFGLNRGFTVIPNGVNVDAFAPAANVSDGKTILYFGGIIRKKGLLEIPHYFNRVIEKHPDATLVLAGKDMPDIVSGNPSTRQMMEEIFSDQAKKRVTFLGTVPFHEIGNLISRATVCIFPSYAEALPVSWLEAMAVEKAIVASDIGWSNEIIDDGVNGFKVSPGDHDAFAAKIMTLLEDETLRHTIEKNARKKIVERFSTKVTASQSLAFYQKIIEQGKC